mmetsp:Transcript_23523/g.58895  ORF Transcript_23523/g.58895 Transcript_23523/m.58895 type:complete len:226 (+) Transcript_23523:97-774(+)|eukprot:CAMPEP_0177646424 /NCGR_PEP_ID=MMETSP0447-20121125/9767_1 /TAXON_ID=0 /ORGANISM="Stygamoeba regulata, Strain BSH-02190019" /LENGTH=225 /DNA_ID=CAMNT_0019148957 /DNA_START=81 /DNA_END=758 /DNA_ORIENTATION=+
MASSALILLVCAVLAVANGAMYTSQYTSRKPGSAEQGWGTIVVDTATQVLFVHHSTAAANAAVNTNTRIKGLYLYQCTGAAKSSDGKCAPNPASTSILGLGTKIYDFQDSLRPAISDLILPATSKIKENFPVPTRTILGTVQLTKAQTCALLQGKYYLADVTTTADYSADVWKSDILGGSRAPFQPRPPASCADILEQRVEPASDSLNGRFLELHMEGLVIDKTL